MRCLTRAFCFVFLPLVMLSGPAAANEKYAGYVYDVIGGKVLYQDDADKQRYPASLTKIMTLYIVFEELAARRLSLDDKFTVSAYAAARPPSKIGFKPGGTIAVRDAIKALVTKSANDVATAVGENIAGSESAFAERMTRTAKRLGMQNTVFRNAHGLPHPQQHTSAHDMALLGIAIQRDFPQYYGVFQTRVFEYSNRRYGNHNKLLGRVEGVDGIKTGYIRASGFNLVTSVRRDGRHIVAVVMGGRTGASRDSHMRELVERYLPKATRGQPMVFAAWSDFGPPPIPGRKPSLNALYASRLKARENDPIADTVVAFAAEMRSDANEPKITSPAVATDALTAVIALADPGDDASGSQLAAVTPTPPPAALARSVQGDTAAVAATGRIQDGRFVTAFAIFGEAGDDRLDREDIVAAIERSRPETGGVTTIEMGSARPATPATAKIALASHTPRATTTDAPRIEDTIAAATTESMTRESATRESVASAPAAVESVESQTGWQIQVGAVGTIDEARRLLEAAASQEPAMRQQEQVMLPVRTRNGTLYRARFAGFQTMEDAQRACKQFANHNRPCWAVSM
ncbi:serine hydrolase [Acuticoccus sp. M5D2P5]|uniref:D-alanyl-D-alanine carboxypeptidase n=1 Tax=Acuticoccus kalidii TaxID=2910977 RepID=UPI001F329513|nr:D-alanyl-D-alanine carboxypeptidase [Acuticoccus kalidii]MCF3935750.1 serine hydrolase [Acuticoccus kalidii]